MSNTRSETDDEFKTEEAQKTAVFRNLKGLTQAADV